LKFGEIFEQQFLSQGETENRSIAQTLDLGWKILARLPREDLLRINKKYIEKYMNPFAGSAGGVTPGGVTSGDTGGAAQK
ncbi:MAG: V-type ATP synthase subunit B, partial [Treponema sp.]|nr:V-type ATP synthase subunit B [Treponema sp.]